MSKDLAYRQWIAADDAFSEALRRAYGRRAGDMRYAKSWPGHPEIELAWQRVRMAETEYRKACQ